VDDSSSTPDDKGPSFRRGLCRFPGRLQLIPQRYGIFKAGGQIPWRLELPELDRVWFLRVTNVCQVKGLPEAAPRLLANFGAYLPLTEQALAPLTPELAALGVEESSFRPRRPGEVGAALIYPAGMEGPVEPAWTALLDWIRDRWNSAAWEDVRQKLAPGDGIERHLFVGAGSATPAAVYFTLDKDHRRELPSKPPQLPAEVTHLWVWQVTRTGRCLLWANDQGWLDPSNSWACD
jgi:hypothetical protein